MSYQKKIYMFSEDWESVFKHHLHVHVIQNEKHCDHLSFWVIQMFNQSDYYICWLTVYINFASFNRVIKRTLQDYTLRGPNS